MNIGKAYIEKVDNEIFIGVINTGYPGKPFDHHELFCCSWNQAYYKILEFSRINGIALTEIPSREKI